MIRRKNYDDYNLHYSPFPSYGLGYKPLMRGIGLFYTGENEEGKRTFNINLSTPTTDEQLDIFSSLLGDKYSRLHKNYNKFINQFEDLEPENEEEQEIKDSTIKKLNKKLSDLNDEAYNELIADEFRERKFQEKKPKDISFETIRNESINRKLDKMIDNIDDKKYVDGITNIIEEIKTSGTSYGKALENILTNPKNKYEKLLVKNILDQLTEREIGDKVVDNNQVFNNPNFVLDLSVQDNNDIVKMLLELKNQISSKAKNPTFVNPTLKETINSYRAGYLDFVEKINEKIKEADENKDFDRVKELKNSLIKSRQLYDKKYNKDGILLTDNKISGAYGETVPSYKEVSYKNPKPSDPSNIGKTRKVNYIDSFEWEKRLPRGINTVYKQKPSDVKALFLKDDALVSYDISKDSNNKTSIRQIKQDNITGKDFTTRFGKKIERMPIMGEFFLESEYPKISKDILGKTQQVRVIPPHKLKLVKM